MPEWLIVVLTDLAIELGEAAVKYIIRTAVDEAGNRVIEFVHEIDRNNDGIIDDELVIHSIEALIPDLDSPFTLVSDGDTVGLGLPEIRIIDGMDIGAFVDFEDPITGNGDGYLVDMDGDMDYDDVLIPLPDFNGDGFDDWGWILDSDENGVPDVSPEAPYYPVGSEGYYEILDTSNGENAVMTKDFDDYTVTEAMLFILVILGLVTFVKSLFRKREVF